MQLPVRGAKRLEGGEGAMLPRHRNPRATHILQYIYIYIYAYLPNLRW